MNPEQSAVLVRMLEEILGVIHANYELPPGVAIVLSVGDSEGAVLGTAGNVAAAAANLDYLCGNAHKLADALREREACRKTGN